MNRGIGYVFFLFFLLPRMAFAQILDTAGELKQLTTEIKAFHAMGYDYIKKAEFPNGDKDQIKGALYVDNDQHFYYNDCDAFLMIISDHWFYNADHRKKVLTIIDLDKKENRKVKESLKKNFFNDNMMNSFFDSVLLKTAIMKKFKQQDTLLVVKLSFPKSSLTKELDMVYNWKDHIPVSYDLVTYQAMQKTQKGEDGITAVINCSHFKKTTDKAAYEETEFFSYEKNKFGIKKYKNYKLSTKM